MSSKRTYMITLIGDDDLTVYVDLIDAEAKAVRHVVDILSEAAERSSAKYVPNIVMDPAP